MRDKQKILIICFLCFYPLLVYITVKAAPHITGDGPGELIRGLSRELEHPLRFTAGVYTAKALVAVTFFYIFAGILAFDSIKNYRYDEEYGSAKWASIRELNRKYAAKKNLYPEIPMWRQNMIFTSRIRMGFDFYRPEHQKNANTLIIGGPGTWKSRGYMMPNIMQMNGSFVVTDPKGEMARKMGNMLKKFGYRVKVFDISHPEKSICYNPFRYFRNDKDILQFVTNFFAATENKNAAKQDDFWDKQAMNLMLAFAFLLYHEAPEEEQNMSMINELLLAAEVKEDMVSAVDLIFNRLEKEEPDHIAVKYYKSYHKGGTKTLQSIQSTLTARMAYFNLPEVISLTNTDDIDICSIAAEKTAVFCVIPDSDASLNFLVGTLYQQMFQQLYDLADNVYNGTLPRHIRFLMDEFANVALPDDYNKILSTARSRNISFAIVLQDKSQIESLFDKLYKTIMACCSEWLFLGSNEIETCELFSKLCGQETVYVKEYSRSYGRNGGYSVSIRKVQRDLCNPFEIRKKANRIAILIIEGEDAARDTKYDMKKHPFYKFVAEGKNLVRKKEPAVIYDWGSTELSLARMEVVKGYRGKVHELSDMELEEVEIIAAA